MAKHAQRPSGPVDTHLSCEAILALADINLRRLKGDARDLRRATGGTLKAAQNDIARSLRILQFAFRDWNHLVRTVKNCQERRRAIVAGALLPAFADPEGLSAFGERLHDGDLLLQWAELEEGHHGEFDPDDPDDEPLLHIDCYRRVSPARAEQYRGDYWEWDDGTIWEEIESLCTGVNAAAAPAERQRGLEMIMRLVRRVDASGHAIRRAIETATWMTLEDIRNPDGQAFADRAFADWARIFAPELAAGADGRLRP